MNKAYSLSELEEIKNPKGNLFKGINTSSKNFYGFGEIYFTKISSKSIKGWKLHKKMISNIIVLSGKVRFVFYKDRKKKEYSQIILSSRKKQILTIFPNNWFAFQGVDKKTSLIVNIANIKHDDKEVNTIGIKDIKFDWRYSLK